MKSLYITIITLLLSGTMFAQVGINADGSDPDNSAMLDVKSSEKGFLPPRMTTTEMFAVASPAAGLMVYNTTLNTMVYYNGTSWKRADETTLFYLGMSYGGGIVFYIDGAGKHGLIAATVDQPTTSQNQWGFTGVYGTSTDMGTGLDNTNIIVTHGGPTYGKISYDLVLNGYSDWYLPSKDELNQMYLHQSEIGGFNLAVSYISSSEGSVSSAWRQFFSTGTQAETPKANNTCHVRSVRSF